MKKPLLLILFVAFLSPVLKAQETEPEMAFDLRSSGKIYVVVSVIAIVFAGIAFYLFLLDKRIKKIERNK